MDGELEVIRRIAARIAPRGGVSVGIGDDAAVLDDGTVLALDMVVDGVHVRRSTHSPADIGHTALAVNISDVAAMGAAPVAAMVGLGLPPDIAADDVDAMYRAMEDLSRDHAMSIVGGDVSASPVLSLSVAIIGRAPQGIRPVLRSGARPGDVLVVTGPLGASAAGLLCLDDPDAGGDERDALIAAHLRPQPQAAHGRHLAEAGATAMIDVSDGLLLDADRVGRASGLTAVIDLDAVPRVRGVDDVARAAGVDPALLACTGGEDYHLLAALPPEAGREPHLQVVGHIQAGTPGVRATRAGRDVTPTRLGWEHHARGSASAEPPPQG